MLSSTQHEITARQDVANKAFWNEPCGTTLAASLGLSDRSEASLEAFDRAFFTLYPYLQQHLAAVAKPGARIVEFGLGYGTVAGWLAARAGLYLGIDLAVGPTQI